jgi:threonyl-tRNA synthetase
MAHETRDQMHRLRHSTAHLMAQAMLALHPEAKLAIGPATETGFFYDFELGEPLTPEALDAIEAKMKELLREKHDFIVREVTAEEARSLFADQPYKLELIEDILKRGMDEDGNPRSDQPPSKLTVYTHGDFIDLCKGPHVSNTGEIKADALKLLSASAAYWRGNSKNQALQRVYGTVWPSKSELDAYLSRIEEATTRDHRNLGRQLELFTTAEEVGAGLILWLPKGAMVRYLAERFSLEAHKLNGYQFVYSPHIGKASLWETSGHLDFYRENMFRPMEIDEEKYYLKPMNCPFHSYIYKSRARSYRELPLRLAEFGTVYRYELSGVLHGLTRVRGFTQDDAHTFCTPTQVQGEITHALRFSLYVLKSFGLTDFTAYISTKPKQKSIGSDEDWANATKALEHAVQQLELPHEYDEGGGAFYGPKIDVKVLDALGREWQLSTVQFDFNLPERFGLEYIAPDGTQQRPVMVHRALFGSVERFMGMLIEHYAGAFPFWIAPVQVMIVPITDDVLPYCHEVQTKMTKAGLRVELDARNERMQAKIRAGQLQKIPVIAVVGKREAAAGEISVRDREKGDLGAKPLATFIEEAQRVLCEHIPRAIGADT